MEPQGQVAISTVCTAVFRATEKVEEEWSPSSLDALIFHVNQLYRLLIAYCDDDQKLEEVGRSLALLTELEHSMEEAGHTGYAANLIPGQNGRGRPKFDISEEQLQHLLQLQFTCPKIAYLLGVSLSTVRRRMTEYGLSVSALYSEISDVELDRLINEIRGSFPNCGYRMMDGHLRQRGIRVTQARIRNSMHRVDPEGVVLRWREAIQRRKYTVSSPLALWHIDGNHKLIRYVHLNNIYRCDSLVFNNINEWHAAQRFINDGRS